MRKSRLSHRLLIGPAAAGLLAACSEPSLLSGPQAALRGPEGPRPLSPFIAHTTKPFGAATFQWLGGDAGPAAGPEAAAWRVVRHVGRAQHMTDQALSFTRLRAVHDTGSGPVVAQFHQRVEDIEVFHAGLAVAMDRRLRPIAASGTLARALRPRSRNFGTDGRLAVAIAYHEMTNQGVAPAQITATGQDEGGHVRFEIPPLQLGAARLGRGAARAKKVWFPQPRGLAPAYYVELDVGLEDRTDSSVNAFVVSADGELLFRHDLVVADSFTYRVWADKDGRVTPWDSPNGNDYTPHPTGTRDGKSPGLKPSGLVTLESAPFHKGDPWLPAGATELKGNNAWAYADLAGPDGFGAGDVSVVPTGPRTFDRTYDPDTAPTATKDTTQAITTNLFYIVNYMHDYFYEAGWDEKSFNPQQDNLGRGGLGGDPIKAEAQDYSGRNNANASAMSDGASPRIQMYLWNGSATRKLTINSPADVAGDYAAVTATFGPGTYAVTANLVAVDDGAGTRSDGCESPFANAAAVRGAVAVMDRGSCTFGQKAANAQKAGAKAALIVNNAAGLPPDPMGGAPPSPVTIPTMGISLSDGDKLKARMMGATVSASLAATAHDRDGSLDTTIVSHEWGHVLSGRLVGNGSGLSTLQGGGMGEGWSDFVSLLTIVRPEDKDVAANAGWAGTYAVGAHAGGGAGGFYEGIRRYPYSTDKAKDPLTFKHIARGVALPESPAPAFGKDGASNHEVHNTGEVWTTMLWECYTSLLKDSRYSFDQANKRMRGYLVAGLKLTPNAPTILEARDALLAAAYAGDPQDHQLFWQAFARRGAGTGAIGPDRRSADNTPVTESFTIGNDLQYAGAALDDSARSCDHDGVLDNGEVGKLTIKIRNTGAGPLGGTSVVIKADNPAVSLPDGATVSFPKVDPYQVGSVTVRVVLKDAAPVAKVGFTFDFSDATLAVPRKIQGTLAALVHYDEAAETADADDFDARASTWSAAGDAMLDGGVVWQRVFAGYDGSWHIEDNESPSDQYLVSPPLPVAMGGGLRVSFKHRFRFEAQQNEYQDGGVIELSTDNGMTWKDVGDRLTTGGYTGKLYKENAVLPERMAFVGASKGYPTDLLASELDLGSAYQGQTVRLRFRVGTDEGTGMDGWDLSEIAFTGLAKKLFTSRVPHRAACTNHPPEANAGADQSVLPGAPVMLSGAGTDPDGDPLTYRWTQTAGTLIGLQDPASAQQGFTAPDAPDEQTTTVLTFQLVVNDGQLDSAPATVSITVDPTLKTGEEEGCGCRVAGRAGTTGAGAGLLLSLGLLLRLALRRGARRSSQPI